MEHWRQAYLGMRSIPHTLNEFELATFFTFSAGAQEAAGGNKTHAAAALGISRQALYRLLESPSH